MITVLPTSICLSSSATFASLANTSFILRSGDTVTMCVCVCVGRGGGGCVIPNEMYQPVWQVCACTLISQSLTRLVRENGGGGGTGALGRS